MSKLCKLYLSKLVKTYLIRLLFDVVVKLYHSYKKELIMRRYLIRELKDQKQIFE